MRPLSNRGALLWALSIFALLGCAQFRGPGDYSGSAEEFESPYTQAPHSHPRPSHVVEGRPFRLSWPVAEVRITQKFKGPGKRGHLGIDIGGRRGTPIFAAHDGYVVYAGRGYKGYGKMIIIEHSNKWASLYAHLDSIKVKEGDTIVRGQTVGLMGRTGRATGVHLHFEVMKEKIPVDPLELLSDEVIATY